MKNLTALTVVRWYNGWMVCLCVPTRNRSIFQRRIYTTHYTTMVIQCTAQLWPMVLVYITCRDTRKPSSITFRQRDERNNWNMYNCTYMRIWEIEMFTAAAAATANSVAHCIVWSSNVMKNWLKVYNIFTVIRWSKMLYLNRVYRIYTNDE